jgi:NAD(P)-dependent dehydrogenase (short-subunit alcohol dehydrogenase family)
MAGGFMGGGFLEAPMAVIRQAIEEKFFANLAIARLAAPSLHDGGSLVFTAGSGGRPHNASGAIIGNDAIRTLVQGLAVELAPRARANAVAPTWTRTPLWSHLSPEQVAATDKQFAGLIPLGRTAKIEEVAAAYLFLMQNSFVTGQTIAVDGGLTLVS